MNIEFKNYREQPIDFGVKMTYDVSVDKTIVYTASTNYRDQERAIPKEKIKELFKDSIIYQVKNIYNSI